jgi:hypothetical protein
MCRAAGFARVELLAVDSINAAVAAANFVERRRPGRGGSHVIFSAPGVEGIGPKDAKAH